MEDAGSEIGRILAEAAGEGDFVPSLVAAEVHDYLVDNDPNLLDVWLHERAAHFLTLELTSRLRSQRAVAYRRSNPRAFAAAVASGDLGRLELFNIRYRVDVENTVRRFGDMTGPDHLFVASSYSQSAKSDAMKAAFHEALARKVKNRRTEDVLTPKQLQSLYTSIIDAFGVEAAG